MFCNLFVNFMFWAFEFKWPTLQYSFGKKQ